MEEISLLTDGDDFEKTFWKSVQPHFPSYESFWRTHIYWLRSRDSIYLRKGIDEEFEKLTMNHYTTFVNLARAHEKIETKCEDLKFSEEIYANLQRAAEVAIKAVDAFRNIYRECVGTKPKVTTEDLNQTKQKLGDYRDILHDPMLATIKNENGRRLIPRRDTLEKYRRWTTVMYERELTDFVPVETQLWNDFKSLCSALQSTWKDMEDASKTLITHPQYLQRRNAGESVGAVSTAVPWAASGAIIGPQE